MVRLGDVAQVALESAERRAYYRSNGEPAMGIGIVKTSTANSLDVANEAKAEADRIRPGVALRHPGLEVVQRDQRIGQRHPLAGAVLLRASVLTLL